jgi:uncharacterized membrane protein YqaE (UPF0057 family)
MVHNLRLRYRINVVVTLMQYDPTIIEAVWLE